MRALCARTHARTQMLGQQRGSIQLPKRTQCTRARARLHAHTYERFFCPAPDRFRILCSLFNPKQPPPLTLTPTPARLRQVPSSLRLRPWLLTTVAKVNTRIRAGSRRRSFNRRAVSWIQKKKKAKDDVILKERKIDSEERRLSSGSFRRNSCSLGPSPTNEI